MVSVSQAPHTLDGRRAGPYARCSTSVCRRPTSRRGTSRSARPWSPIQACDPIEVERLSAPRPTRSRARTTSRRCVGAPRCSARGATALAGDLDRAEKLIEEARTFGEHVRHRRCARRPPTSNSASCAGSRAGCPRCCRSPRPRTTPPKARIPGIGLVLARVLVECERYDEARAPVVEDVWATTGFAMLRRGPIWSSALVITAETCGHARDDRRSRAPVRDALEPFADQVAFTGSWVTAPIAYGVGIGHGRLR